MPTITLPDASQRQYDKTITVADIAADIGPGLAKAALAGKVDGKLVDLTHPIDASADVAIITAKDPEGLEILRHSTAHLLAHAVKRLYPEAQVTIGPVIENGFYYDFAYDPGFKPEDLEKIEAEMHALVKADIAVTRKTIARTDAIRYFEDLGEHFKAEIIRDLPEDEILSLYEQAEFTDLCRGPHVPRTSCLKVFKLTHVAGAYWRGDANNAMLQRIYGTAWPDKKAMKAYFTRLEEAEKRDHRKLAKKMNLFHLQEEAPGMVFWHANGWTIYQQLRAYLQGHLKQYGYQEINTPQLVDYTLWEKSGHASKFSDEMFVTESEKRDFAVKPMSCPCHVQVYNQHLHSYRDLPIRLAEFGACHRNEPSGALHGIMRVRGFVQDDAHIFCTPDQLQTEIKQTIEEVYRVYADFGFKDILVKLSTRPEKRVGADAVWDTAEKVLADVLNEQNIAWELNPGEGAFYGPKIEFSLQDCIGRVWQCGTVQVDFSMPERLGASYIDQDSSKQTPIMIHRAILGSLERFIGILLEHYEGHLPLWLAPIQVVILTISEKHDDFATKIAKNLQNIDIRATLDLRNEKIGFKIREHTLRRVPYLVIIGDAEVKSGKVALRLQAGKNLGSFPVSEFMERLKTEIDRKGLGGLAH